MGKVLANAFSQVNSLTYGGMHIGRLCVEPQHMMHMVIELRKKVVGKLVWLPEQQPVAVSIGNSCIIAELQV